MEHVAGYCIGLDITTRGPEERSLRKSADGYSVLGPWLVTADELGDPTRLTLVTRLDGKEMQRTTTDLMIFDIPTVLEYVSAFTELAPGDVIATGTPGGVGFRREPPVFMRPGDVAEVEISGIGTLRNPVVGEAA